MSKSILRKEDLAFLTLSYSSDKDTLDSSPVSARSSLKLDQVLIPKTNTDLFKIPSEFSLDSTKALASRLSGLAELLEEEIPSVDVRSEMCIQAKPVTILTLNPSFLRRKTTIF